jgi:hypothetical protein
MQITYISSGKPAIPRYIGQAPRGGVVHPLAQDGNRCRGKPFDRSLAAATPPPDAHIGARPAPTQPNIPTE